MKLFAQTGIELSDTVIARQLDQPSMESYVQGIIRINIFRFLHLGHHGAKLPNVSQTDTAGGKTSRQAEQMSAHVVNLRGLRHAHFPDEDTAIGNDPHEIALLKTSARFAYRSAANA